MLTADRKRIVLISVISLVILALILGTKMISSAQASLLGQTTSDTNRVIAYPGQLTGDDGNPVADGSYDFIFTLFDAPVDGNLLWSEMQKGITVRKGAFGVLVGGVNPLPDLIFATRVWLSVSVRSPQADSFNELTPRQLLDEIAYVSPDSPAAVVGPCIHDHFSEAWAGSSANFGLRMETTGGGDGIRGISDATLLGYGGVYGYNSSTTGSGAGVSALANSSSGYGIYAINGPGTAIYGSSTSGVGIRGQSSTNDGIVGYTTATGRSGVYGYTDDSYGITGQSNNFFGIQARGYDSTGDDALGDIWLDGERGEIFAGQRLNLYSNWNINLDLDHDNDEDNEAFRIYTNGGITPTFSVDGLGNLVATGSKSAIVETDNYGRRLLYSVESPEVWFEDIGSAELAGGVFEVVIEPIFAQTVNLQNYQVFLTPVSNLPVILYVFAKTPTSFIVHGVTLDGKPASCSFDYRIIAKRRGYEDVRLRQPFVPETAVK